SASFGIAMAQPGDNWTELLQRADAALYEAKRSGRNRVRLGVPHPEEAEPAADGAWA
ncbi:MAG: diguanylate cyclase domain-containing protein, partial [Terriglobales bacterium]